jgi:ATP-dependent DNA helicase DinG
VEQYFGPSGRLAAALPGFEPRAGQAALAQAVFDSLEGDEHLLAEAGTGTGKSLAYLIPALVSGQRVVVATATKALQEQLLTKDVPAAAAALGRKVRVAVLKGRQNYLCRRSLASVGQLGGGLFTSSEDAAEYERLAEWIDRTDTGDRAELSFEPSSALWTELSVGADRCAGRRCPFIGSCYAEAARSQAAEAELVIANHALYFADVALRSRTEGTGVLPEHDAVVFDEAHRLEEAAASWFGGRVSLARIRQLARDVERHARETESRPPARALADLDRAGVALVSAFDPGSGRRRLTLADEEELEYLGRGLCRSLRHLADDLSGSGEEADALGRRALGLEADVEACMAYDDPDRVAWAESGALAWAPVDVSEILREEVWGSGPTAVLVSATLEPDFLRARLGLDDARELVLPSPFDYREQALLYVPPRFPEPRSAGYEARLADEVVALCNLSRGRALVLTCSYRALDELVDRARPRIHYPLLVQGEAPRERLLERFRDDVESVLFATATFWQGVDVAGESLSLLVVDKLPFSSPGDPLVEARCERIVRQGGDWFADYALPAAVLQLRQGFGRLIRGHADEGVVAVLDSRVHTRAYGRRFLEALPPARLVADRDAVADFFGHGARATA